MAQNMRDIKRRIKSVSSVELITSAMKLVSAAKLRRAKATFEKTTEYFHFITDSINEIFNNASEVPHKYLQGSREIEKTCYIVITSSKGLCGSFNSNVIKEAAHNIQTETGEAAIVAVGTKGRDYFKKRDVEIISEYIEPPENISFIATREISRPIIELYDKGEIDKVVLVSTMFINNLEQRVRTQQLLPFIIEKDPDVIRVEREIEYEPSVDEVFNYLVPKYVEIVVFGAIIESATCEHAARRMAMESATDNAREMLSDLSLFYNRARQAAITSEIIEVISGSEAQK
ncbi:MAG: ATP synthase F1 subunit gamma [Clostridiales bacterium]|nr:ATP synthase F1 subunit gamma [Clostridiales bacterium]